MLLLFLSLPQQLRHSFGLASILFLDILDFFPFLQLITAFGDSPFQIFEIEPASVDESVEGSVSCTQIRVSPDGCFDGTAIEAASSMEEFLRQLVTLFTKYEFGLACSEVKPISEEPLLLLDLWS